jgi:hypothetical protein
MNADPIDTRCSHLDLEDLIAGAAGQATGDRTTEHLAICERCRAESKRWHVVADGVRGLAAAAPEADLPVGPRLAARPQATGHGRRRIVAASAAAGVLLIGGASYGISAALTGRAPGTGTTTLTAVNGCAGLEQADGTLEQVNGSSLVIKTASGQPVTVTTTASAIVGLAGAALSDITDGAPVRVTGTGSDGTVAAALVTIGLSTRKRPTPPPGVVTVQGTVSDASAAGFTIVTPAGARVRVTTSAGTVVTVIHASLDQLPIGASAFAIGHAGSGGTLSAKGVLVVSHLPAGVQVGMKVRDCSPASVADALGSLVVRG